MFNKLFIRILIIFQEFKVAGFSSFLTISNTVLIDPANGTPNISSVDNVKSINNLGLLLNRTIFSLMCSLNVLELCFNIKNNIE